MFNRALDSLAPIGHNAGVTLIPMYTNVRHLDDDDHFSLYVFQTAVLSSVALTLSNRLTTVYVGGSHDISGLRPWGSHPLLGPNYSNGDLQIQYDSLRFSRFDKAKLMADWDVALENIRVCPKNSPGMLNCGECEKCVRTMLAFLALGELDRATAFPAVDMTPEFLEGVLDIERLRHSVVSWRGLIEPLTSEGRPDLAAVIKRRFTQLERYLAWEEERDRKGLIKGFNRRYLGSSLFESYGAIRGRIRKWQPPDTIPQDG